MKNNRPEKWKKILLAFVNVSSLIGAVLSIVCLVFTEKMGTENEALKYGYDRIARQYVASMVQKIDDDLDKCEVVAEFDDINVAIAMAQTAEKATDYNEIWNNTGLSSSPLSEAVIINDKCVFGMEFDNVYSVPVYIDESGINLTNIYTAIVGEPSYKRLSNINNGYNSVAYEVTENIEKGDLIYEWKEFVERIYSGKGLLAVNGLLMMMIYIATIISSVRFTGVRAGFAEVKLSPVDRIPIEILTLLTALAEWIMYMLMKLMLRKCSFLGATYLVMMVMSAILLLFLLSIGRRTKTRKMLEYSLIKFLMGPIIRVKKDINENLNLLTKVVTAWGALTVVELVLLGVLEGKFVIGFTLFIVYKIIECVLLIGVAYQAWILQKGAKRIAKGRVNEKIDTDKLCWELKKHGESINKISDGIALAVEERMKSERMKTELITNVSHDIKTPLTSIINYVDLIKKENVQDERLCGYVEVLDRQSLRLKKLIEDLIEASRASTGNVDVNMDIYDIKVILSQALGEFDERLREAGLEVVLVQPEEEAMAMVDGRHLWRVFDNLINNICKYSLEGTRVYIVVELVEKKANKDKSTEGFRTCSNEKNEIQEVSYDVCITFKNMSKNQLNISPDELMERFVRGDGSRHTEGSGLGLSIARSLTEIMNGEMKLDIDGDLFKVVLKFSGM